jgi:hypothetical protein
MAKFRLLYGSQIISYSTCTVNYNNYTSLYLQDLEILVLEQDTITGMEVSHSTAGIPTT